MPHSFLQSQIQSQLISIQPQFKANLLESVEVFKQDLTSFTTSYSEVCRLTWKCDLL